MPEALEDEGRGGMMISRSGLAKSCCRCEAWRLVGEEARRRLVGREERREVEVGIEEGSSADIVMIWWRVSWFYEDGMWWWW